MLCVNYSLFSQKVLVYSLKIGDTIDIQQLPKQTVIQEINENTLEITNKIETHYRLVVKEKTDSSYHIAFKIKTLKLRTESNQYGVMLNINTDSANTTQDPQTSVFKAITKPWLSLELLKTGKIAGIKGSDQLIKAVIKSSNLTDKTQIKAIRKAISKDYSSEALAQSLEQITFIYSKNPVVIGQKWTNNYQGELEAKNTWYLENTAPKIQIKGLSKITLSSIEEDTSMQLQGTQQTQVIANKTSGLPELITVTNKAKGVSTYKQLPNKTIPTEIISKTQYKIKHYVQ